MRSIQTLPRLLEGPHAIVVNTRARTVQVGREPVTLTRLAFDILAVLLDRRGDVVTHEQLADLAWGYEATEDHGAIQTGIYRLRLALNRAGAPGVIRAIRGVGYAIEGDIGQPDPLRACSVEAAFGAVPFPTLLVNPDGQLSLANEPAAELTGIDVAVLESGSSWLGIIADGSRDKADAAFAVAASGRQPDSLLVGIVNRNQASSSAQQNNAVERPVRLHIAPVSERDKVIGILVTIVPEAETPAA